MPRRIVSTIDRSTALRKDAASASREGSDIFADKKGKLGGAAGG